jgi:hypothetical protein
MKFLSWTNFKSKARSYGVLNVETLTVAGIRTWRIVIIHISIWNRIWYGEVQATSKADK